MRDSEAQRPHRTQRLSRLAAWFPSALIATAWLIVVARLRDPLYDDRAVACSVLQVFVTAILVFWKPSEQWRDFRLIALVASASALLTSGGSVLQSIDSEDFGYPIDAESLSDAIVAASVYVWMTIAGVGITVARKPRNAAVPASDVRPWVVAAGALVPPIHALWYGTALLRPLGTLPLVVFSPVVIVAMVVASKARYRSLQIAAIMLGQAVVVFYSASLFTIIVVMASAVAASLHASRKIPSKLLFVVVAGFVLLNPAKHAFRQEYTGQRDLPAVGEAANVWTLALQSSWSGETESSSTLEQTAKRLDYNTAAAAVFSQVPAILPYEYGGTYAPIVYSMVPRVLYPDKPDTREAGRSVWNVRLGLVDWEVAATTSVALPASAEAYWNFGWAGVLLVPLLMGLAIGILVWLSPRGPVARTGYVVGAAVVLCQGNDMLITVVPGIVAVMATVATTRLFVSSDRGPAGAGVACGTTESRD